MKKTFLFLLAFLVFGSGAVMAQDAKAIKKVLKKSTKALKKYKSDNTNTAKLDEALSLLDEAMKMDAAESLPEVWMAKGDIYQAQAEMDINARNNLMKNDVIAQTTTADAYVIQNPEAAPKAYAAYLTALEKSEKKGKVIKLLEKNVAYMNDIAFLLYANNKDFSNAYECFNAVVNGSKLIQDNGGKPLLDTPEKIDELSYNAAFLAKEVGKADESLKIYEKMYNSGSKKLEVYSELFTAYSEKDEAKAMKILGEGRELEEAAAAIAVEKGEKPSTPLLFAEINYYLEKGDFKTLEGKLSNAMKKEPNNVSLRFVMANVYNNFYKEATDEKVAEENFAKAIDYYNQTLDLDGENFAALYNLGELYYNKAAKLIKKYSELPVGASSRENESLKSQYLGAFDEALPFFLKADDINSSDHNTILALKEIYAKKDDFEKSKLYKDRLEALKQ